MAANILTLLERAAEIAPANGIIFYEENRTTSPNFVSYPDLLSKAKSNSKTLLESHVVSKGQVVLLHLGTHFEYVEWFWSVIAAGGIPVVSTPLAADPVAKERHLKHLERVLKSPKILTTARLVGELAIVETLDITPIELLEPRTMNGYTNGSANGERTHNSPELAFLMLTSGSTGNAKAVECRHSQVFASLEAKSQALGSTTSDIFLNWIGFDHVACVSENHLHAMLVGSTQIQVAPTIFLQDPVIFFEMLAKHSVTISFAPNFFLAASSKAIDARVPRPSLDLSKLRHVVSGGEANVVLTGIRFNETTASMGAPEIVMRSAFGMTETLAASHYHADFPALEKKSDLEFCSVGRVTGAIEMRITDDDGKVLDIGQDGNLELSGPAVFKGYYNDHENTQSSFTEDGWFKTGDKGYIGKTGHLILSGRAKDSIIINGVKYFSHELETALEEAKIPGMAPSYCAAFSSWPKGSDSEELVLVFLAIPAVMEDDKKFTETIDTISKNAVLYCSKKPIDIIPLPIDLLPKSALGKLSRPKLKKAYEKGEFDKYKNATKERVSTYRKLSRTPPKSEMEKTLVDLFAEEFSLNKEEVGVDDSLADMGVDSIRLIRYKNLVQDKLGLTEEIPMISILQNPSIKGLSDILSGMKEGPKEYNPMIELQSGASSAPPIFFFHPGLGEILVFLNLSKFFAERRVYAIRAPGFNPGEQMFRSIDHMTDVYLDAIRKKQPEGPYVLIGYSFGAMIAFEVGKKIEASGGKVGFIGTLNLPPHIKFRMIELDWTELVLNLVYFLGFISEKEAHAMSPEMHKLSRPEVLTRIMKIAPKERLRELDLNERKIHHWAELSSKLQGLAHNYDPSGSVETMDVFYAVPLIAVGQDKNKWLQDHLLAWNNFVRRPVTFHDVPGSHYTMMNPENVFALQKSIRSAMKKRGIE